MRPDYLSIAGILLGFLAITGGNWLEGGHLSALANGPAAVVVLGGTLGASLLQTPVALFVHALRLAGQVFASPAPELDSTISRMVEWSRIARRDGLLGLEREAGRATEPFLAKGLQLVVDGSEPEEIRDMLEVELDAREHLDLQAAAIFEAMGGYAPTIGILGAVMGLIHVMQNLADPAKLGPGIATAFVATIYGVGLANLVLLPIASKLKTLALARSRYRDLVIEGLVGVAEGENPRNIELKLKGFL